MSYFPVLSIPGFECRTTVFAFPPNDWELKEKNFSYLLHATWVFDNKWNVIFVKELYPASFYEFNPGDFGIPGEVVVFLFYSDKVLSGVFEDLATPHPLGTSYPQWRGSISVRSDFAETSYLGEVHPFRNPASCLSFGNLLQLKKDINEYFILLNLEHSPKRRGAVISLYGSEDAVKYDEFTVYNNSCNVHKLEIVSELNGQTPIFVCEKMGGIPLFLSVTMDGAELSLEHTHPPGSMVVHGDRMKCQSSIKKFWFDRLLKCAND